MSDTIAEPMTDNEALREILGEVRLLEDLLRERYDDIEHAEDQAVTQAAPYTRAANADAVKTAVTNQGAGDILIYEGGALVGRVASHATWVSPRSGKAEIVIYAATATASTIAIATWTKE